MQSKRMVCCALNWAVISVALLSGLLLPGCERRQQSRPSFVPEVTVVTIRPRELMLTTELPGRTSPYRVAEIRPQVSGIIQKRSFTEGSDVKKGQVLYQIDPAPFKAALESAAASLARSRANLPAIRAKAERYRDLLAKNSVSQQDYDDREAALKHALADIEYWKAEVETARINLSYTRVTAPISGRIGRSNVTVGALVTAYQPRSLATIQQLDPIYVDVSQSTSDLLRLRRRLHTDRLSKGVTNMKKVRLILVDGTKYPLEGVFQFRDVTVDPTTGCVILRVVFPNPEGILLPGMFVRAVVKEGVRKQAILVPQQAVSRNPKGDPFVFIVDKEGKIQRRMLSIDRAVGDEWLVSSGLATGDRVVVEGIQKVRPGVPVKVFPFEANGKPDKQPGNASRQTGKRN